MKLTERQLRRIIQETIEGQTINVPLTPRQIKLLMDMASETEHEWHRAGDPEEEVNEVREVWDALNRALGGQ